MHVSAFCKAETLRFVLTDALCFPSLDIDDCDARSHCCQQDCYNYPGGYECVCYAGYRLNTDGCGCDGKQQCLAGLRSAKKERHWLSPFALQYCVSDSYRHGCVGPSTSPVMPGFTITLNLL